MRPCLEILLIASEPSLIDRFKLALRRKDHAVTLLPSVEQALACLESADPDLIVLDRPCPEDSEARLLEGALSLEIPVLALMPTPKPWAEAAVVPEGVAACLEKPFDPRALRLTIESVLEKDSPRPGAAVQRSSVPTGREAGSLVGESEVMQPVFDLIGRLASTTTHVLVSGESGTGKELVARAIHDQSARARGPFVAVNCGAIPENLLESELFGHVKGAFTGASRSKEGLFSAASGGTLFLDEVAELPLALQVKLLRVIQDRQLRPVGGTLDRPFDARLISATNKTLQVEVDEGRFRKDLFYRINVVEVGLPSLRQRRDDIPILLGHFMRKYAPEVGREIRTVSDEAMQRLMAYDYPGNVRELENLVERAMVLAQGEEIDVDLLPESVTWAVPSAEPTCLQADSMDLEALLRGYEYALLSRALQQSEGVKTEAARRLGISFRSFRYRWQKLAKEGERLEEGGSGS